MELDTSALNRSEILDEPERVRSIHGVQSRITDLLIQAGKNERHVLGSQFSVFVETPYLPGSVMVGGDLEPSSEPYFGIKWEYEIYVVYPLETGSGEPSSLNMYYLVTTDDDLVRLDIDESKYMPALKIGELLKAKNRSEQLEFVDQAAEAHNRMDYLVREEIQDNKNGRPVPLEEIKMLLEILDEATIIESACKKSA